MIVLCGGAFDPLHEGHVLYLRAARACLGQEEDAVLYIAVATDAYIRTKGRPPVLLQQERVALIRALDLGVVLAQDHTGVATILQRYRPDVYVLGEDYRETGPPTDAEAIRCRRYGVEIRYVAKRLASSTAIMARYREAWGV
jgi:cytidyltransferase-like protein